MQSPKEVAAQAPAPKLFIFDRDDTLVKNETGIFEIINPEVIIPFIEAISLAPNSQLAIASKGALDVAHDPAMIAFKQAGATFGRLPYYAQYGTTTLANYMVSVEGVTFDEPDQKIKANHSYVAAEAQIPATNPEKSNGKLLQDGVWTILNGNGKRTDGRQITLTPNTVWTVKLGQTLIKIKAKEFFDNFFEYYLGDCKIVAIFLALDALKLRINVSEKLMNLGFIAIETPANYQEIEQRDVVFLDDRPGNCAYVKLAGFTAIDADTPSSGAHGRKPVQNTYLRHLIKALPQNVYDLYHKLSDMRYWQTDQQTLLNRAEKASVDKNCVAAMILYKIAFLRVSDGADMQKIILKAIEATLNKPSTKLDQPHDNTRLEIYLKKCREEGGFGIEMKLLEFTFEVDRGAAKPLATSLFSGLFSSAQYSEDVVSRLKNLVVNALQLKSTVTDNRQQQCEDFIQKIQQYAKHSESLQRGVAEALIQFNTSKVAVIKQN